MTTTVFHTAAKTNYMQLLHFATKKDCNTKDQFGMTPVLWAASRGHREALSVLYWNGGNLDEYDDLGNTALHLAVARGDLECINLLVGLGANPYCMNIEGHTAQQLADAINHEKREAILDLFTNFLGVLENLNGAMARSLKEIAKKDYEKLQNEYMGLGKEDHSDNEEVSAVPQTQ